MKLRSSIATLLSIITCGAALAAESTESTRAPASTTIPVPESTVPRSALRDSQSESPVEPKGRLSELGIDFTAIYKFEYRETVAGGIQKGAQTLGNLDLRTAIDMEKLVGARGLSAFVYVLGNHGGDDSLYAGDTQVTSNIEAPSDFVRVYEAWVQQLLFEKRVSILAGLHDLNSEFYVTDTSALFFNSSFGVGKELAQTGANGPSIFPVTAPALRLRIEPTPDFYLQVGVFNAISGNPDTLHGTHARLSPDDGLLTISEAAYVLNGEDVLTFKYGVGFWQYSKAPNSGTYFLIDQTLSKNVGSFLRYGIAAADENEVAKNLSAGFVLNGSLFGREKDKLGIAFTSAFVSEKHRNDEAAAGNDLAETETVLELNYRWEIMEGVALQPDYQYVFNPSMSKEISFASVIAARLELSY